MSSELTPEQEKQVQERMIEAIYTSNARILKIMKEHFGEAAYQAVVKAQGEAIRSQWHNIAEEAGNNSIEALIKHLWEPLRASGFEYTMEETESGFQMNCTKCPGVDMAKRHGITEEVYCLSCESDPFIAEGFNPNIGFKRTKTLMQGHNCCDHFYYYKDKNK